MNLIILLLKKSRLFWAFVIVQSSYAQIVSPFNIRHQVNQKGNITLLSNVAITCNSSNANCGTYQNQLPPTGNHNQDGNIVFGYVDVDNNSSTFQSSSDSLSLPNCSEITWAGLYWSARVNTSTTNYSDRNKVKIKTNNGAYQQLTADQILDIPTIPGNASFAMPGYYCFKDVTSILQASGANTRVTVADIVSQTGSNNLFGAWTIFVVYKNTLLSMRNLTVFDGMAYVSNGNTLDIPISGFNTPNLGPVSFQLGVMAHEGDRNIQGDRLQFNGNGAFLDVPDPVRNANDFFNSTSTLNGGLSPFRIPSYNNNLGFDSGIFNPNNSTLNYLPNASSSATIRVVTSQDAIIPRAISSAIDIYEPDLRSSVRINDLNGGLAQPGDILEYTIVGKNIGSDISVDTYMTDTLDPRVTYMPGTIQIVHGPNLGNKTDVTGDDQAEYLGAFKVVKVRIGTGANATTGGQVVNSPTGADSTVVKFKVTVNNDCLLFTCDNLLDNVAYIFGEGNFSGNLYDNDGITDAFDANGCPTTTSNQIPISLAQCPPFFINSNGPICVGSNLILSATNSLSGIYNWSGPNGFISSLQSPIISNATNAANGVYSLSITFNGLDCIIDSSVNVTINSNPVISNAIITNVSCFGANNGSISLTMSAPGNYNYSWSNGANTASISNLAPGNYTVTITNSNGCNIVSSYTIIQPLILGATATATTNYNGFNISCFGFNDGAAAVTPSGGTAPYTYLWSTGSNSQSISNLTSGSYSVTVADANGCTSQASVVLTQPTALSVNPVLTSNVSCFGGANGAINITANGGVTPYGYGWSNGSGQEDISNLTSGNYSVIITDANGCTINGLYAITQPALAVSFSQTQTNVSCFGGSNGSINITTIGGTSPYSYVWSNGITTEDLTNISSGSYSLTITDANGCQENGTFVITEPAQPITATSNISNVLCFGDASGAINISVQGGTAGYLFSWSNGATIEDISGLSLGTYTVIITDANGCSLNQSYTVNQPAQALSISGTVTAVSCNSGNDGGINIIAQGGTAPYSYSWSNGATSANLVNLSSGNYTLTVTDANGCQTTSSYQVSQPLQPITLSETHIDVSCNGGNDGAVDLIVSGGTNPYSFSWSNGTISEDQSGLFSGTYSVIVTDANGCSENLSINISQPVTLTFSGVVSNVLCFNGSTGSINGTTIGGTSPYIYSWSNGATLEDISNLTAGNYSITTTDANGCSTTNNFTVTEPLLPLQLNANQVNVLCAGGNNASIDLTVSNGTAPYTYVWSNSSTTEDLINLASGTYSVNVTDANGCTAQLSVIITEPSNPLTLSSSQLNVPCFGQSAGSIDLSVTGGTGPFDYLWSNGQITQDIIGLAVGTYSVSVTDNNGCTAVASYTISQPNAPLTLTETHQDALCLSSQTGSIDLTISGGTPSFIYLWNNGATTEDLTGLNIGSYSVTVTDANACTQSLTINIFDPANTLTLSETHQNVTCFGGFSGSIDLTISNPSPITSIAWSNGAGSEDISGLAAGNYFVNVTDLNGCNSFLSVSIAQPLAALSVNGVVSNVACFGQTNGGINLTVTGGTAPYSYTWSDGSTNEDIGNLAAGNYSVLVTDANGCTANFNATITEPTSPITAGVTQISVSCFGGNNGSIDLSVSGGVSPYSYSWNNGSVAQDLANVPSGNYSVVIQDASGCSITLNATVAQPALPLTNSAVITNVNCSGNNSGSINITIIGGTSPYNVSWTNGNTTEDLINVNAGIYSVSITDLNGCISSGNYQITQPTNQLTATIAVTNVICHNGATGTATVTPSGGTAPYVYNWSNGENTPFVDSLLAGNISVTVTDAAGCTSVLNAFVSQPNPVVANTTNTNNVCYGQSAGNISVVANGGIAPYTYLWNTGSTLTFINNLSAGPYFVQITDANGCTTTFSDTVYQPANTINVASNVVDNICFGEANGAIDITISGGVAPYQHLWNTGLITEDLTNLLAGQYTVTVVDNNGCLLMQTIAVNQPVGPIIINGIVTPVTCFATNTGAINVSVTGPNAPITYLWSNGSISEDIINQPVGNYTITATNTNGCTTSASYQITQPLPLSASATLQQVSCFNASNGGINLTVSGGTTPYTYNWSNGQTTEDLTNIPSGTYSVTITDINGCFTSNTFTIIQPSNYSVSLTPQNVLCFGGNSGQIFSVVNGGTAPYTYLWNSGANTSNLTGLIAGNYTLSVIDNNGCVTTASTTLSQPAFATTLTAVITNETCANLPTGSIDISINSPTPGFTYFWNNGSSTQDIIGITANTYSVSVTDNNGCITTSSFQVNPAIPITISSVVTPVDCFNNATGSINISPLGGAGNYTYSWSNGATSEDISNLTSGNYFITITDQNNCSQGFSFNISQPNSEIQLSGLMLPVSCAGGSNGGIDLSVSGGSPSYIYSWSNGTFGQDLLNVIAGNYSVVVTDINGCSKTESYIVAEPVPLGMVATIENVTCFGGNNGSIDLTPTGGIENYTITWSNGETTEDILNLTSNVYQVNITDNNGCAISSSFTVTQPNSQVSISLVATNVSCFGSNDGAVDMTVSGGTLPYTINWNNGQITEDLQNLIGGSYDVTVSDSNGCSTSGSINVISPIAPLSLTATTQNVTCLNGSNGQVDITVNGGTAPYTYAWSNGAPTQDIIGVVAGNYSVVVTDNQGCTISGSYAISQPSSAISVTSSITPVSCFDGNDGAINLTINGGLQPYSISWSNGAFNEDILSLTAGNYTVNILDASSCLFTSSYVVNQPIAPLSVSANLSGVSCFGFTDGSIDVTASGGTPAYTYTWSNNSSTEDIQTLSEGGYSLTVTDANGCQLDSTFSVLQPSVLSASSLNTNVLCFGASTGAVNLNVFGGILPYTYNWNNGAVTQDLSSIPAGPYSVLISDANGCDLTYSTSITQPNQALTLTETHQNVPCFGANTGSINLSVLGGTPNYTYNWSSGATTQDIANLVAGNYTVNVTDANNCTSNLTITVQQPSAPLTISSVLTDASCFGLSNGSIDVTINGGTAPFTYFWNTGAVSQDLINIPAGQYTLAVTDVNNCVSSTIYNLSQPASALNVLVNNITDASCFGYSDGSASINISGGTPAYNVLWNNGSTSTFVNNLTAGTYTATVTDANGCENIINVQVNQPAGVVPSFVFEADGICSPVNVEFTNTSQGTPSNCTWQMGNGQTINNCNSFSYSYNMPGCYSVTLTTSLNNGCISSVTLDSIVCVQQGPTADFVVVQSDDAYFSGDIQFNNGSINADFYTWNFGDNSPLSNELNPQHTYPGNSSNSYQVELIAEDSSGCVDTAIVVFTIEEDFMVYVPNAFTLDGNDDNESFLPIFSNPGDIKQYHLMIYNRWGQLIWESFDMLNPWDGRSRGKDCQDGVYTWKLDYTRQNKIRTIIAGHVSLLR